MMQPGLFFPYHLAAQSLQIHLWQSRLPQAGTSEVGVRDVRQSKQTILGDGSLETGNRVSGILALLCEKFPPQGKHVSEPVMDDGRLVNGERDFSSVAGQEGF